MGSMRRRERRHWKWKEIDASCAWAPPASSYITWYVRSFYSTWCNKSFYTLFGAATKIGWNKRMWIKKCYNKSFSKWRGSGSNSASLIKITFVGGTPDIYDMYRFLCYLFRNIWGCQKIWYISVNVQNVIKGAADRPEIWYVLCSFARWRKLWYFL